MSLLFNFASIFIRNKNPLYDKLIMLKNLPKMFSGISHNFTYYNYAHHVPSLYACVIKLQYKELLQKICMNVLLEHFDTIL